MTNRQTIQAWYNGKALGHNTRKSIFFEGGVIYSYSYEFPMACLNKQGCVLMTMQHSPSVTTTKHMNLIPQIVTDPVFYSTVLVVDRFLTRKEHEANLNHFEDWIRKSKPKCRIAPYIWAYCKFFLKK